MAKGLDVKIPNMDEPWENYNGDRVEEFIKDSFKQLSKDLTDGLSAKPSYFIRPTEKGADNCFHIYGFASEADYLEWNDARDEKAELLLSDVSLPEGGGGTAGGSSYVVNLLRDSSSDIVTIDNTVKLNIRFTSQEYNPITQTAQDTTEGGILTVQTRLNDNAVWATKGTIRIQSMPADSTGWTEVDITDLISPGTQQVRIIVKGEQYELNTRYLRFNVTKTQLGVTFATQWERPIDDGVMRLGYYIGGAVSKTLHILIDGKRKIERNIGTTVYSESPFNTEVTDSDTDVDKVLTHGVHTIEAWLAVNNSDVQSKHVHSQVFVLADRNDQTPYLFINDLQTELTNWTTERIFTYAIYNPTATTTPLKLEFGNFDGTKSYMTLDMGLIQNSTRYELSNVIEIDSEELSIDAYMRFFSGTSEIHAMLGFSVDNRENFSPTSGADLVLNPRSRTNDEANPGVIINNANNVVVPSTWEGFKFKSDGWVTDASGQRCLRVPAGHKLFIDYEAYKDFIDTDHRSSLTIEVDFATRNATDLQKAIMKMCSYMASDGLPLGFEMKPQQAIFLTEGNREVEDQDVPFQEGERTHLAVNIIYGINNTSVNYVRLFINGEINREFQWTPDDNFVQYVNGVQTSQGIVMGNDSCDIDIYGLRVYRKSLSANDIRQNYMASLPTVEEKIAFREANNICDDSNQINYEKTREKYNTMLITGQVPDYLTGNIKTKADLEIHIVGDPAHSGKMNNMTVKGQGTSSRSYFMWNFDFGANDDTVWIDEDNNEKGNKYQLDDTVPKAKKLVAKRNWASSQQSHKLGSCNLFTDLWRRCTGGSSITRTEGFEKCRVSVKQKPFMVFLRATENEIPRYYGQYTFGPGKGDKPTFGCDLDVFPNYLMLEGCDNGMPLTNHRIPWNEDILWMDGDDNYVTDIDSTELFMYNGEKQWEICMGNGRAYTYFVDAFNFVYLHQPHINPWVGTLATLQAADEKSADRQQFYWVTQASNGSAKFDLYRYDNLTKKWVDAGVKKLGEGSYEKLNLSTQLGITPSGNVWSDINQQFINARVTDFKNNADRYFKLDDAYYHQMFIKLIAASDNRAKNTYLYLAEHNGRLVIHFAQDDLDTIFLTDNVGRKNKPYYVEEHDRDANGSTYWNGEQNAMYDLFELAFPMELRSMMNTMLTQMANMATENGGNRWSDKLMQCMEDYYFHVQRYFPAVAYNETARISYEAASAVWGLPKTQGGYTASTHPITQSLGSQLQGEIQWVKLRMIYLSSFASYGQFRMNGDNSLTFRSKITKVEGLPPTYSFALTPHIWLYPAVTSGSSTKWGRGNSMPQRVKAGETFILDDVAADDDTNIQIHGIDQYSDIGEFGDKSLEGTEFTVAGERLKQFIARTTSGDFRPPKVNVIAPNITKFDIAGASDVKGAIDFTTQTRLEYIDISGTGINRFSVADPSNISILRLPATLTQLELKDYTALQLDGFTIDGVEHIQTLSFSNCPNLNSQNLVSELCACPEFALSRCSIVGVDWTNFPVTHLLKLAGIKADLKGKITINSSQYITFENKKLLLETWGNIDDPNNKLYVEYTKRNLQSVAVAGKKYFDEAGTYQLGIQPNTPNANNYVKVRWTITNNSYATINEQTGLLNVTRVGTEDQAPSAQITVYVTLANGTELSDTVEVGFYHRSCKLGDYVFADGTYSNILDRAKTAVGICFYIDRKNPERRLAVALQDVSTGIQWGLYFNNGTGSWAEGGTDDKNYNIRNIELVDTPNYDAYDIPTITNIGTRGLYNAAGADNTYISDETFRDEQYGDEDGFKVPPASTAMADMGFVTLRSALGNFKEGDVISLSLQKTLQIIQHRDTILGDSSVNLPIPYASDKQTAMESLNECMTNIVTDYGAAKYRQYYYPAASLCHAYQPNVKTDEVLSPLFLAGRWALPGEGDLSRLCWYHRKGYTEGVENAIFAKGRVDGVFTQFTNTWYWSASEYSRCSAWYVGFSDGGTDSISKYTSGRVRAVVAF